MPAPNEPVDTISGLIDATKKSLAAQQALKDRMAQVSAEVTGKPVPASPSEPTS